MSTDFEDMAAQMTGTVGIADDAAVDQPLPDRIADSVEEYDQHVADCAQEQTAEDLQADTDDDVQQPARGDKRVPLGALQEERSKRQILQQQLETQAQQLAQYQQQLAQFQAYQQQVAAQQQQQQADAAIPDPEEDPIGFIKAKERQFAQQLQNIQQAREYEQFSVQVQQRAQQLTQFGVQAEIEFQQQHPDYREAYDHVDHAAMAKLRQLYPGASEQQLLSAQAAALFEFVDGCQRSGKNPAQVVYEEAQRQGFTPGQRTPGARKPAPTSLSTISGAGRAPDEMGKVSARDIASMSNDAFDKYFESMREAGTQRPAV